MTPKTFIILFCFIFSFSESFSQVKPLAGDPLNPVDLPGFWKSRVSDIEKEMMKVQVGKVKAVAVSPGGHPVYAVYYGKKEDLHSQANYNSAVAARDIGYYAKKGKDTKPVLLFLGPVHGQEMESIVGLVNLIHIAETGKDYRGKDWSDLKRKIDQCRVIIIPCANPDGRERCPYDSFVGLQDTIMTKYGQGTKPDGTFWGWPGAKALHPMVGEVGLLGAYFNDDGINMMHDDFFAPMASETKAILDIARWEAPDLTVSLHSFENAHTAIFQPSFTPMFIKERIYELAEKVYYRYTKEGIPDLQLIRPELENYAETPGKSFNLVSALHHLSGTAAFTFECSHGTVSASHPVPAVSFDQILDIELCLFDEMLSYAIKMNE